MINATKDFLYSPCPYKMVASIVLASFILLSYKFSDYKIELFLLE